MQEEPLGLGNLRPLLHINLIQSHDVINYKTT